MKIVQEYLDYIQEQVANAHYDYPRPYDALRAYYQSCAKSCDVFKGDRVKRNNCIFNCKLHALKRELLIAQQQLARCGKYSNLKCQDAAKKKIIRIQKKIYNNIQILRRYRDNENK